MTTRRGFLQAAGGVAGLAVLQGCATRRPVQAAHGPSPMPNPMLVTGRFSLRAHAAAHGFLYGCAVKTQLLGTDAAYTQLIRDQANIVVAENSMKWGPMRPTIDTYKFDEADKLVAFAEANGMKVRGHNLCWHRQLPRWFDAEATTVNARGLLTTHIQTVVGRYAGRMHSWDVVNEAVQVTDGRADGLRDSPWMKLIGADYIELAFQTARSADPQALLTYNDYGIEGEDPASERKRAAVLELLRRMKARHVPVDALGIQAHITAGQKYGKGLAEFMTSVRGLGLQMFLTEMDVNDRTQPADDAVRDSAVAETYANFLDLTLRDPALRAVLTWGISDRGTWLNGEDSRPDKLPERPLPFDADGRSKKAFFAMRDSFDRRVPAASHG